MANADLVETTKPESSSLSLDQLINLFIWLNVLKTNNRKFQPKKNSKKPGKHTKVEHIVYDIQLENQDSKPSNLLTDGAILPCIDPETSQLAIQILTCKKNF